MSHERPCRHRTNAQTRLIVPVSNPNESHAIKYFILNEEPKGYICDKGCVHEYPSKFWKEHTSPKMTAGEYLPVENTAKGKHAQPPVAFKYLSPGKKAVVPLLQPNSSIMSSDSTATTSYINSSLIESQSSKPKSGTPPISLGSSTGNTGYTPSSRIGSQSSKIKSLTSPISSDSSKIKSVEIQKSPYDFKAGNSPASLKFSLKRTSYETQKCFKEPLIQEVTETGFKKKEVKEPIPHTQRNPFRNFLNPSNDEEITLKVEEKEYDKNSNVFSRLYPFIPKPKQKIDDVRVKMDWQQYHRLSSIYDFMDELETLYPSLCTVGVIGHSLEGRDIKLLKISNGNANNSPVWIDAGIHAREWIGPAVNTYIANHIARNFDKMPGSCKNKDWYFLPVVNPDGYEFSHTKQRMWRKSRAWAGGKCVGVDLNRNFSVGWGGKGSSSDPDNCFYRGTHPFSEPESCAVKSVLQDSRLPFKVYITLHAFGEVIIFPLAHSDDLCPDYIRLLQGATAMSRAIYNTNGTTYRVGVSKDVMYRASGTSNDWCYSAVGIPYCYLIELRSKKHRFKLPEEEINDTGSEILNCVIALMEFVDNYPLEQNSGDHKRVVNIWKEEHSTMDVMVDGPRVGQLAGLLHERGIPYSVAIGDLGAMLCAENGLGLSKLRPRTSRDLEEESWGPRSHLNVLCFLRHLKKDAGSMDWSNYHRLGTIYTFMDSLAREYPYLVTLHTIGKTVEGRNIVMMKISNGKAGNSGVWIDGTIHAREWISAAVVTYIANALVRTYHELPSSITNKDWYILPVLNPDGYEYTHTHDRMWRKNRAHYGGCIGVDLNRNFSYGWGENGEEGSSEDPGNVFFRGSKPFSEPESQAVKNAIEAAEVPFKVFLSFHSYGEVIIFPWGYSADACPNYVELLEGGTAMSKAIFETSGRVYKVGSTKDLMYYAAGTSVDWAYGTLNIPYSYMIELRGKKHRFLLPRDEILATAQEIWNGVMRLMDFVDRRCKATQHCVCPK